MTTQTIPALAETDIIRRVAGLRPCRAGGLRLERDALATPRGRIEVVHNYGHGGCGVTLGPGTAEVAADLVEQATSSAHAQAPVLVLGAGVVGLTTALELLNRGYPVTVAAERTDVSTTSNIAGALWLPTGIDFPEPGPGRDRFNAILARAFELFTQMDAQRWGIERLPVIEPESAPFHAEYFEHGAFSEPTPIDAMPVPGPHQGERGKRFDPLFIHTPRFLTELRRTCQTLMDTQGGRFVRARAHAPDDLIDLAKAARASVVVNALGLGSKTLFNDDNMYPARGLLVHAAPCPLGMVIHNGYRYCFPREDALVLGGCFEPGETDLDTDSPALRARFDEILNHHRRFFGVD